MNRELAAAALIFLGSCAPAFAGADPDTMEPTAPASPVYEHLRKGLGKDLTIALPVPENALCYPQETAARPWPLTGYSASYDCDPVVRGELAKIGALEQVLADRAYRWRQAVPGYRASRDFTALRRIIVSIDEVRAGLAGLKEPPAHGKLWNGVRVVSAYREQPLQDVSVKFASTYDAKLADLREYASKAFHEAASAQIESMIGPLE